MGTSIFDTHMLTGRVRVP